MQPTLIYGNSLYPDRNRLFPIRRLADGTPCIIGTPPGEPDLYGTAISVYLPEGQLAPMHPHAAADPVFYEIALGYFVSVCEFDLNATTLILYTYRIQFIGPDNLAHGVPVSLN